MGLRKDAIADRATVGVSSRAGWPVWLIIRLVGAIVIAGWTVYPRIDSDILHYATWAIQLHHGAVPYRDFHVEYPPGVLPLMLLPSGSHAFELCYLALAYLADATVFALLRRDHPGGAGALLWLAAPIVMGPLLWLRLDVFVAAALVGALSTLRRHQWRRAGACLAAAALLKLWPLLIVAFLWRLLPSKDWRLVARWSIGVVTVAVGAVVAFGGASGLWWMIHYQTGRGLELESLLALPLLVAADCGVHLIPTYSFGSVEFALGGLASTLLSLGIPLAVILAARAVWRDRGASLTPATMTLLIVVAVLLPSKMISAQYAVWPIVVTAYVLNDVSRTQRERVHLLVATCALGLTTQFMFPLGWDSVLSDGYVGLLAAVLHAQALIIWAVIAIRFALPPVGHPASVGDFRPASVGRQTSRWLTKPLAN